MIDGGRWTLGFVDPNHAGLLCGLVASGGLLVLLRGRSPRMAVIGAALAALALACLVLTGSRAALVGVVAAAAVAGVDVDHGFRRGALVAAGSLVIAALLILCSLRPSSLAPARDGSMVNRLHIWRAVPALCRDYPAGCPDPGDAYSNWYQPIAVGEYYTNLVSAHLQVLATCSHPWRVLYVVLWLGALLLAWRAPWGRPWFLTVWISLALNGCAGSALCQPLFATLACGHLLALLTVHLRNPVARRRLPGQVMVTLLVALPVAGIGWLALSLAVATGPVAISQGADGSIQVGDPGRPLVAAVLGPSRRRCGSTYGLDLRRLANEEGWRLLVVPDGEVCVPPDPPPPPLFVSSAGFGQAWFARWRPSPDTPWGMVEPRDLPPAGPEKASIFSLDALAMAGAGTVIERHYRRFNYTVIRSRTFRDAVRCFVRRARCGSRPDAAGVTSAAQAR